MLSSGKPKAIDLLYWLFHLSYAYHHYLLILGPLTSTLHAL